jgi:hypothetical protein
MATVDAIVIAAEARELAHLCTLVAVRPFEHRAALARQATIVQGL